MRYGLRRLRVALLLLASAAFAAVPLYGDLTIEALKTVAQPAPGSPAQYSIDVHIVTTGLCTLTLASGVITCPAHPSPVGNIPAHRPYLMSDDMYFDAPNSPAEAANQVKHPKDPFTGAKHAIYTLSGDEISIVADMETQSPLYTASDAGSLCPTGRYDVSLHWVPSMAKVMRNNSLSYDSRFFAPDPPSGLVAGRLLLSQNGGALRAHVVDSRLYEFQHAGFGLQDHAQAVSQMVDYSFRINGPLKLYRRKFNTQNAKPWLQYKPDNNGQIFIKLGNTPEFFIDPNQAMTPSTKDEHFTLHYDVVINPPSKPVPTAIGICADVETLNCNAGTCTSTLLTPTVAAAKWHAAMMQGAQVLQPGGGGLDLSVGGLDCGPDGLP